MNDIEKCPFCNSLNAKVASFMGDRRKVVVCIDCGAHGPIFKTNEEIITAEEAIVLWNNHTRFLVELQTLVADAQYALCGGGTEKDTPIPSSMVEGWLVTIMNTIFEGKNKISSNNFLGKKEFGFFCFSVSVCCIIIIKEDFSQQIKS